MNKTLYKMDSNGNIRVWSAYVVDEGETEGEIVGFYTVSGVQNGKMVTSGTTFVEQKNVGKKNETSLLEQANLEVQALYVYQKLQGGYFEDIERAKAGEKTFLEPMLAQKYDPKKVSFPVVAQPKLDGIRCVAKVDGLWSRQGKRIISAPHIEELLKPVFDANPDLVFDGELYNHDLKHDFNTIISLARKSKPTEEDLVESAKHIQYHIYDSIGPGTFEDRTHKAFVQFNSHQTDINTIKFVETVICLNQQMLDNKYGMWIEDGYEGQMLRIPGSLYEHKRSKSLVKRKEFIDEEFEIVELEEGIGNWAGYVKSVVIKLQDGSIQKSGIRGNFEANAKLLQEKDEYIGGQATVRYQDRTPDNKLRFPVVTALFKGKRDI